MHFQRKMLFMRNRKYLCRHALIFYKQMVIKGVKECVISVNICTFSFFNIDETKSKTKSKSILSNLIRFFCHVLLNDKYYVKEVLITC